MFSIKDKLYLFTNPLQYSCLENPVDRGAWWTAAHRVTQSWTGLKLLAAAAAVLVYMIVKY